MKKLILFFSVLFFVLVFIFYKIQSENVYMPSLTIFFLFCFMIKLLYNRNEKKKDFFFPIVKSILFKANIIGLIVFIVSVAAIDFFGNKKETWMNIGFSIFYGIGFIFMMLTLYQPYLLALRRKKIVFERILPFAKKMLYTEIKEIAIESKEIIFTTDDGDQTPYEVKLTEEEKNKMIRILTKHNVTVIY